MEQNDSLLEVLRRQLRDLEEGKNIVEDLLRDIQRANAELDNLRRFYDGILASVRSDLAGLNKEARDLQDRIQEIERLIRQKSKEVEKLLNSAPHILTLTERVKRYSQQLVALKENLTKYIELLKSMLSLIDQELARHGLGMIDRLISLGTEEIIIEQKKTITVKEGSPKKTEQKKIESKSY